MALGLWADYRRGCPRPAGDRAGRACRCAGNRRAAPPDETAASIHRSHSALGNGGCRQTGRGRRSAGRHGSERSRYAGDARRDYRGPASRGIHQSRRPGTGAHAQGLFAHVRTAHAAYRGARLARAHRRMGAQAQDDRSRQADARGVHEADQRAGEESRHHHQNRRDSGRGVRHGARALPQMRRRGAGKLPQVPMPEMRLRDLEGHLGARMVARGDCRADHQALNRAAHRLSQPAGQALQRGATPDGRPEGRVRLRTGFRRRRGSA
ncbi:MAG: hypothetical protein K0R41_1165 [Geminicoccaceae bacterium]|nr:hypothetical protein [Geminicoccaceae bacterium]